MKIIPVNQKLFIARRWGRWYKVTRGGEDWRRLEVKQYKKKRTINQISKILSESHADKMVAKNTPKAKKLTKVQ